MPHVDEGGLHAYLDGALDLYPAAEAEWIRAHVVDCPACAERLEEARADRSDTASLLALADPGPGEIPPLEELRRRAATPAAARRLSRLQRTAWAASVVVALGTGWMLRGGAVTAPDATEPVTEPTAALPAAAPAAEAPATAGEGDRFGLEPGAARAPTGAGPAEQPARAVAADLLEGAGSAERVDAAFADVAVADADETPLAPLPDPTPAGIVAVRPELERPSAPPLDPLPPTLRPGAAEPPPARAAEQARPRRTGIQQVRARALDSVAGAAPVGLPTGVQPSAAPRGIVVDRAAVTADVVAAAGGREAERDAVERREAGSAGALAVPGLRVISIEQRDVAPGVSATWVRQELEGDVLEIVRLPPRAARALLPPSAAPGVEELAVQRGGRWVVLRARTTRLALEALARRLDDVR